MRQRHLKPDEIISKTREIIEGMSSDDLSYVLGRYCGPHNILISERTYGFILDKKTVEAAHAETAMEEILFD